MHNHCFVCLNSQKVLAWREPQLESILLGHMEAAIDGRIRTSIESDPGRVYLIAYEIGEWLRVVSHYDAVGLHVIYGYRIHILQDCR